MEDFFSILLFFSLHCTFINKKTKQKNRSPVFAELAYLPIMIFPFVKVFGSNELACFETTMVVLTHWCNSWFETVPSPPIFVFNMIENLLAKHDPALLQHFTECKIAADVR